MPDNIWVYRRFADLFIKKKGGQTLAPHRPSHLHSRAVCTGAHPVVSGPTRFLSVVLQFILAIPRIWNGVGDFIHFNQVDGRGRPLRRSSLGNPFADHLSINERILNSSEFYAGTLGRGQPHLVFPRCVRVFLNNKKNNDYIFHVEFPINF